MVKITIKAIPDDSTINMDGKNIKAGSIYVRPGSHLLVVSRQYFDSITKHIDTKDTSPSDTIYLLPVPNSDAAKAWLNNHPEVQQQREAYAGLESQKIQGQLLKKYPVIRQLPVYNSHYRIDYSIDPGGTINFSITLYPIINGPGQYNKYLSQLQQYKAEALRFLKNNRINPAAYKITYTPDINS